MTYETLSIQQDGPVMTVRMNRPEKRNAISNQMHFDIQEVCRRLADDFETRAVILGGEGPTFSAGADTSEWGKPGPITRGIRWLLDTPSHRDWRVLAWCDWLGNRIEPYVLGLPFSLAWVVGWVLLSFVALVAYHSTGQD